MTTTELENIKNKLNVLERELKNNYGLSQISGGFVHIDLVSHDKNFVYIKIKDGVQSDVDNDVNEVEEKLYRKTLNFVK